MNNNLSDHSPYNSQDVVTQWLIQQGIAVETYYLPRTRIVLGGVFRKKNARIAYRFEEETETLIVSYYQHEGVQTGLKNSFAGLLWFFDGLAQPELKIKTVKGHVDPTRGEADGLSTERLSQFYRMLGATPMGQDEFGTEWMGAPVEAYRVWRARHPS